MKNKVNIAEILKLCPTGMKLNCTMYDNVFFDKIDENIVFAIRCYTINNGIKTDINFTSFGTCTTDDGAKCVIFPEGKTTWKDFVPLCIFKDGDIVSSRYGNPFILKAYFPKSDSVSSYCALDFDDNFQEGCNKWASASGCRYATEEEKQKLFDAIKANGYKWNAETKTLEELVEPKFKVGDRIRCKNGVEKYGGLEEGIIDTITDNKYGIVIPHLMGIVALINITDQDNWELVALKFKTGDRIRRKIKRRNYIDEGEIKSVSFNFYDVFTTDEKSISIPIREQDEWELVPDKIKPKFKDGDIISDSLGICIFKREGNHSGTVDFYCGRDYIGNLVIKDSNKPDSHFGNIVDYKLATEEEKQKLFNAIGVNGLKWNAETKTLEKSTIPKYKFRRSRTANDLIEQFRKTPVNTLDIPIVVDDKEVGDVQFVYDEKRKKYVFNFLLKDK